MVSSLAGKIHLHQISRFSSSALVVYSNYHNHNATCNSQSAVHLIKTVGTETEHHASSAGVLFQGSPFPPTQHSRFLGHGTQDKDSMDTKSRGASYCGSIHFFCKSQATSLYSSTTSSSVSQSAASHGTPGLPQDIKIST